MSENTYINEFEERKRKVNELREMGVNPYPERYERDQNIAAVKALSDDTKQRELEQILENPHVNVNTCGRIMLVRSHGKLTFAQLKDHTGQMQICFMKNFVGEESYALVKKLDIADFVGVKGELFVTKHGELTILVKEFELLGKTLRPLPEKFHGLKDTESLYRYRYLDLLTNQESFNRFVMRTKLIKEMRKYMDSHGFMEVETPVLTSIASGAAAKPFETHHNALDIPMFLRIAPETYLKRCIVGGFDRVYEIARCFRNEGMDPSHLQEFTMLEYYGAYWNYEDNMNFTEKFLSTVIKEVVGSLEVECLDREGNPQKIDFTPPWPRHEFAKLIEKDCGINILDFYTDGVGNVDNLRNEIKKKGIHIEKMETMGFGNLCDSLYKKVSRPQLIQPCFVIKHPVDTKPLARKNDEDARLADTFQVLVNTWEIVNAYSELVDPVDQRERLERQAQAKEAGDEDAMPMDEDYLLSMEHGMPPISGWGLGIDRFMALLSGQDNLKDTVLFPIMKPEPHHQAESEE
ncbi:lysine--tRNA ligase [Candidatus Peregrinibacteria bacterium]|nr:lysine--tRNA ligase [Candidatus Peregrinibacteria bacterium]